jgi:hypothetical protein
MRGGTRMPVVGMVNYDAIDSVAESRLVVTCLGTRAPIPTRLARTRRTAQKPRRPSPATPCGSGSDATQQPVTLWSHFSSMEEHAVPEQYT